VDPVFQPWQSPYNSMDNNPIWHNDVLGDWVKGAGFWRNMKSSDGQIKAEDFSKTISGSIVSKANNGDWGVTWTTKETITLKDKEGNDRDKDVVAGNIRIFKDEESNDLTGNAFFRFMGLLDYGVSNMRGSMDNYGKLEGTRGAKDVATGLDNTSQVSGYIPVVGPFISTFTGAVSALMKSTIDAQEGKPNAVKNTVIRTFNVVAGAFLGKKIDNSKILKEGEKTVINGALNQGSGIIVDEYTK
jgi:hypothetical protein